ncbi:MAG: hypothetical protein ABIJ56_15540 [Pseudomonadota bacterium]
MRLITTFTPVIVFAAFLSACALRTSGTFSSSGDASEIIDDVMDTDHVADQPDENDGVGPECGNGSVDDGEDCDDGNDAEGDGCDSDCTFSCAGNADCRDDEICNGEETCDMDAHVCRAAGDLADGFVCDNDPRSICLDGVCGESACGDGFVDTGGGEFCEPPGEGACTDDCVLGCEGPGDCPDDGNPCNGDEFCDMGSSRCARTGALADGDACGTDPRRICIGGSCQEGMCGDSFTDSGAAPAEECDDGNAVNADGCDNDCTYSCHDDNDCGNHEICDGVETCDTSGTHACLPGENAGFGTECDDGLYCTLADGCDGDGSCEGLGDPCEDTLECTINERCIEGGGSYSCSYDIASGACLIGDACRGDGDENPSNGCQVCSAGDSGTSWTAVDDMSSCGGGVCCGGTCRAGGNCCGNEHCTEGCKGSARACAEFEGELCAAQQGCSGGSSVSDFCYGSAAGCSSHHNQDDCEACGCDWSGYYDECRDNPAICYGHGSSSECGDCGCEWGSTPPDGCSGSASGCGTFRNRDDCEACGCNWHNMGDYCDGTPDACVYHGDSGTCGECGCDWGPLPPPSCTGGNPDCDGITDWDTCWACGCYWDIINGCRGDGTSCSLMPDGDMCGKCGCGWSTGACTGTHAACGTYGADRCAGQLDCHWSVCDSYTCT